MLRIVGPQVPLILWIFNVYVKLSSAARKYMCVFICVFRGLIMRQHVTPHLLLSIITSFLALFYMLSYVMQCNLNRLLHKRYKKRCWN